MQTQHVYQTSVKNFWADKGIFLLVMLLFVVYKLQHLSLAYYWDESWPYVPAIMHMHHHGISLLPSAIPPDLSKGHPLFFHALASSWSAIFGTSHIAMHSFALCISVVLSMVLYEVCNRLYGKRVAIMAIIVLFTQVPIIVQSSFVLPEILLSLLVVATLYSYVRRRYMWTAALLAALVLTKESGLVLGLIIGADTTFAIITGKARGKEAVWQTLSLLLPLVCIVGFFLYQHRVNGWYFYPEHIDMMERSWKLFWYKFRMGGMTAAFHDNLKWYCWLIPLALAIVAAIKNRRLQYMAIFLPAFDMYYFVDDLRAGRLIPSIPFFIVFIASVAVFLFILSRLLKDRGIAAQRFVVLGGCFIVAYLIFSGLNFFTYRYIIVVIVLSAILLSVVTDVMVQAIDMRLYYAALVLLLAINICAFLQPASQGDTQLGAFDAVRQQMKVVDFLEKANAYQEPVATHSFLISKYLTDPATGFLHSGRSFEHVSYNIDQATRYIEFDNIESPDDRRAAVAKDPHYRLVFHSASNNIWAEVYEKVP